MRLTEAEREGLIEAIQAGDEVAWVEELLTVRSADMEGWLARLESAAGFGSLMKAAQHQRDLGVSGDHETRLRGKRVVEMVDLITEAMAFREDAVCESPPVALLDAAPAGGAE